ncbi:MAG: S9 family peptidase [Acidobacteriota bacterium]|nr:S9 family peptidase [Acidobacteriota bacterium]
MTRLTKGDFHVSSNPFLGSNPPFDWSPDGTTIVFEHLESPLTADWTTSDISCVPSDGGPVRPMISRKGVDSKPRYSPDGKKIVFASDNGNTKYAFLQDFYVMPAEGGEAKKLAETHDRYSSQIMGWSADGREFTYLESSKTSQRLFALPIDGGQPRMITKSPGAYSGVAYDKNRRTMAYIYQTTELPPDIYISDTEDRNSVKLTEVNAHYPQYPMGKTEVLTWKSRDGLEVEGLLTYPVQYEKGRRYPLLLNIHGGPTGVYIQSYTAESSLYPTQVFAEEGFAVLRPNPRGSAGYGSEFRFANYNDWGFGDYEDVMSGVDKVIEMGVAHPNELCVMGWSYGGYLTSFVVTKTDRFKAASVGAGFPNLMSFTGTTDVPGFIPDYMGGQPWDRLEAYMKHSAMFNVKGVTTPTQILHGEVDTRIPIGQGLEFYNALKQQGCPTEMIVYPRTPHSPREPKFVVDITDRVLKWFNKHLGRNSKK